MNNYGHMKDTLRRSAKYQGCDVVHAPGYGEHSYRITMEDGGKQRSDVFWIESERELNAALNVLSMRLLG